MVQNLSVATLNDIKMTFSWRKGTRNFGMGIKILHFTCLE